MMENPSKDNPSKDSRRREWLAQEGKRTLGSIVGAFLYAVGINWFAVSSGLYTGGILGICQVIRTLLVEYLHLPFQNFDIAGIIYYIVNIPLFIVAFTKIGKRFFVKTVIAVTASTVFLAILPIYPIVDDVMAASIVGGIVSGAGVGILLRMGSSGGGMDIIGVLLIKWRQNFSVGRVALLVNGVLYGTCFFLFDIEIVVYSLIYAAVFSVAMDKVHVQNINVEVNVITKVNSVEMEKKIFEELGRGITKWQCLGAYTHENSQVLYIMLSKYEVNRLKHIVHQYDPQAFIVVNEGVNVSGNYLKKL